MRALGLLLFTTACAACATAPSTSGSSAAADTSNASVITVNPSADNGAWEGWGTSLAWWGKAIGGSSYRDLYADLVFSQNDVSFMGKTLPGLGLNIARYNVGGGGHAGDVAGVNENVSPKVAWFKDVEGYWLNWNSQDPTSSSWDWSRDADQRATLEAAIARGVDHVEFFSDSPMWWMVDSKSNSGGNLQAWNHADHARYLATVAEHAKTAWGIPVGSVEAFNEPGAGWWKYPGGQEGCNIPKETQSDVIGLLSQELTSRGLSDVALASSDENTMTAALADYQYFESQHTADAIGKVNVHGYSGLNPWRDNNARKNLRNEVGNKRLWMSEYGDNDGSGMALAQTIAEDLVYLRPAAWIYWQAVEPTSAWGFVNANYPSAADGPDRGAPKWIYTKYYVMAQFTRYLRPGQHLFATSDANTVAGYDAAAQTLSMVTVAYTNPAPLTYDFSNLDGVGADIEVTETNTGASPTQKLFQTDRRPLVNGKLTITPVPNSIYSLRVTATVPR
jgi:galactan endo-1,6-beta-galactosidase